MATRAAVFVLNWMWRTLNPRNPAPDAPYPARCSAPCYWPPVYWQAVRLRRPMHPNYWHRWINCVWSGQMFIKSEKKVWWDEPACRKTQAWCLFLKRRKPTAFGWKTPWFRCPSDSLIRKAGWCKSRTCSQEACNTIAPNNRFCTHWKSIKAGLSAIMSRYKPRCCNLQTSLDKLWIQLSDAL